MKIQIQFDVLSAGITQEIELREDCKFTIQEIKDLLNSGDILTGLGTNSKLCYFHNGQMFELGKIIDTTVIDAEYNEFEVSEE